MCFIKTHGAEKVGEGNEKWALEPVNLRFFNAHFVC